MSYRISFKRLFLLGGVLLTVVCVIHVYLTMVLARQQHSGSFVAFRKTLGRRALYFLNHTKPSLKRSIQDLDKIQIRVSATVGASRSWSCSKVLYTPPAPEALRENFAWQKVEPDSETYLFSAYYESRTDPPAIRIVGIFIENFSQKFCQLWVAGRTTPEIVEVETMVLPESHDKRFTAVLFLCYLPRHLQVPYAVSIVRDACQPPLNILKIMNIQLSASYEVNFTVCVTPLNFHFDNYDQLVEIIEVNRVFGAERFVLYNHTTGFNVDRYLSSYEADDIVSIIPWKIPVEVDVWPPDPKVSPEIHYFGQMAALNDCLYRNLLRSRFIVFTDLDEVIVPRVDDTWLKMISRVTDDWFKTSFELNNREMFPGSYLVQNTFFRLDWDDVPFTEGNVHGEQALKLMTLRKLKREKTVYLWYVRSKYIVWSKMTVTVAIHSVLEYIDDLKVNVVCVEREHALVHHYRVWDGDDDVALVSHTVDDRMRHFAGKIVAGVSLRHQRVTQVKAV